MLIELWWWVEPLYQTSILMFLWFIAIAALLNTVFPKRDFPAIVAVIGIIPLIITILICIIWFLINISIIIWS